MKRHLFAAGLAAVSGLACNALQASAPSDIETFEGAPAGNIGKMLQLDHFRIEPTDGTSAAIRPIEVPDELASGLTLGAPDGVALASMDIVFDEPRTRVDFTLVTPAGDAARQSVVTLRGEGDATPYTLGVRHNQAGNRVRLSLGRPDGKAFERLSFDLRDGAVVDNVDMQPYRRPDDVVLDFSQVREGAINGNVDTGQAVVMAMSNGIAVDATSDGGRALTSRQTSGNDVMVVFREARSVVDVEIEADGDVPATIDFLLEGNFESVATVPVESTGERRHETYKDAAGRKLQGIRWTGGRMRIHNVILRNR